MADHLVAGLHCTDVEDSAAAFVLGALEPVESAAVRRHLEGCPEAHAEVAALGSVVPALYDTVDLVEPPAGLRDRILGAAAAAAAADTQRATETQLATDTQRAVAAPPAADMPRVLERQPRLERQPASESPRPGGWVPGLFRQPAWAGLAIAASLALVAIGVWNVQLQGQVDQLAAYRNGVVAVLDEAAQPGAQLAVLAQPDGGAGPSGLAAVSGGGASVSMVMRDLEPTSGGEVYEAWVIAGNNAPVPIGHFTVDASGTATFVSTAAAPGSQPTLTVALTREAGPGATSPTLPIIAFGTTQAVAS